MRRLVLSCVLALSVAATAVHAQQVVNLWPGVAPGSENWKQTERTITGTPVGTVVMNVVTPTITAYLPTRAKATGTSVIIAPGGAFVALATSLEGEGLARWLQQRGIAAFLLKYRTIEKNFEGVPQMDMDTAGRYGIADGIQAIKVVRAHARAWHLDTTRVGIIGFSAGGMVAAATALQEDSTARPSFAAIVYGAPFGKMPTIPARLPPLFMAWAQDDRVALQPILRFHDALLAAGARPEIHAYSAGGHGFGMKKQGTPSDHWVEELYWWLGAQGLTNHTTAGSQGPGAGR